MVTAFMRGGKSNRYGYYYVSWKDANGKRKTRCTKTTDKATARGAARRTRNGANACERVRRQQERPRNTTVA